MRKLADARVELIDALVDVRVLGLDGSLYGA
jgi:hypothetical protein